MKSKSPVPINQSLVPKSPKVAIVHDWLYGGGAELVVEQLHKLYPEAPIYTSYCSNEWRKRLDNKVVTGYLQQWPFSALRKFLPVLRQHWFANLDLSSFDLVISSSGNGEAKFVLGNRKIGLAKNQVSSTQPPIPPQAKRPVHVCYCHTPPHFYWHKFDEYLKSPGFKPTWLARLGLKLLVKPLRKRDYQAAQSVDYFVANSKHIKADIKQFYGRDSVVIHPPVDTERFAELRAKNQETGVKKGYIIWGRHVPYKRFDLAIAACNQLHLPLTVVSEGPETERLKNLAGPTVTFAGRVSDDELANLAHQAQAFLFPGEEDFGISPVEALSSGLPVIAYKAGGALDYITEGKTGQFFEKQTVKSLVNAVQSFKASNFEAKKLQQSAKRFSRAQFQKKFTKFVDSI